MNSFLGKDRFEHIKQYLDKVPIGCEVTTVALLNIINELMWIIDRNLYNLKDK